MERSRLIVLALAGAIALGCNREPPPETQAIKGGAQKQHSGSHFVVRPESPPLAGQQPAAGTSPAASAPPSDSPADPPSVYQPQPLDPGFPTTEAPSDITPIPSPVEEAFNPLRISASAPAIAPEVAPAPNPLRSVRTARALSALPKMSAPSRMSAPPPAREFATGEMALPPAAADPPAALPPAAPPPASATPAFEEATAESAPAAPRDAAFPPATALPAPAPSAAPRSAMGLADLSSGGGAAPSTAATAAAPPAGAYDVVPVFYATDRRAVEADAHNLAQQISRFLPTAISGLITLALGLVAVSKRRPGVWMLVGLGTLVSLGLGYQAASGTLVSVRRSAHVGPLYTSDRSPGGQVQLGVCEVTIPKTHTVGELEAPSILRLEIKPDADKHVILSKTERLADAKFYEQLRARVAASPRKELFVFVHGFNVTFEDAARRTAQIQKDLDYQGAPVFFSWPAHDKFILTYKADEANVSWSASHLKRFLLDVTRESQAQSISLIAHSMGNRALTAALKELQLELRDQSRLFNQVILAAPDIDADEFRESIAPGMLQTANRFTLYASARDEALAASQLVHRGPRAGDAGRGLVVLPGIDTIDVTQIDTSAFGHTYYGSSDPVLRDLGLILTRAVPPEQRVWLAAAQLEGRPYWIFQPATAATARAPSGAGFQPASR
jgi:esterase/lipase superfamily enzyme